jgi:PAS domain S-box-containing protein
MDPQQFNEQIEEFRSHIRRVIHKYSETTAASSETTDALFEELSGAMDELLASNETLLCQKDAELKDVSKFPEENPNPILRLSMNGVIRYANPASRMALEKWDCQVGGPVPADWMERVRQINQSNQNQSLDLELGSQWFSFRFVPIREAGSINVYGEEITERKQSEQRLIDQADLFESVHDAIIATDAQMTITAWNRAAEELYGWTQAEAIGQNASRLLQSDLVGPTRDNVLEQVRQTSLFVGEVTHHAKDGRRIVVEVHNRVRKDTTGQIMGYISANRDITYRRQIAAERERLLAENQRQKNLLDAIFEADPGGLAVVIGDGLEFAYANPAYRFLCPHNGTDLIGQPYEAIWNAADLNCYSEPIREVVCSGRPFQTLGFERHFPDGAQRVFTLQARRIDWDDQPAALIALWDTTEARQAEELIRESERRESTILASITDCCYLLDKHWRFTRINDQALEMFHKTRPELLGRSFWDAFPQARGTIIEKNYLRAVQEKTPLHYETLSPINGLWVEVHTYPSTEGMLIIFRDITSRRDLLAQVEHQAAELTALFDAMTDVVVLYDAAGKPVRANRAAIQAYGFDPCFVERGSVIRKMSLRHPDGSLYRVEELPSLRAIRGETISAEKAIFTSISGDERTILMFSSPIYAPDRSLSGLMLVWHDITEMELAAKVLARYQLLFENTPEMILFVRLADGRILEANRAAERAYGYSRDELLALRIADLRAPDTHAQIGPQMADAAASGILFETRHCRKDGETFSVEVSSIGADLGGERVNLSIIHDISERKQAEQVLAAQQEWFHTTLASIGDAVITTDAQGTITFLNPVAERITGWSQSEADGQPMERVFPIINELTQRPAENPVGKVLRQGGVIGLANHTALIARDGRIIPIEDSAAPIQNSAGETLGVVMVFHDVTEKRKAEEAVLRSELRFRSLYENNLDGCLLTHPDGAILSANPQACQMLGMTEAEICQAGRAGIVLPSVQLDEMLKERQQTGKAQAELTLRRKDGSTFVAEVSSIVYTEPDGSARTSLTFRDITDRYQAQQALQRSEERYRGLFEGMTEGFALHEIQCDEEGHPIDYRFLEINPAFEQLTGLRREQVLGKLHNQVLSDDDPKWVEIYGRVALTGEPVHFENYSPALKMYFDVFAYRPAPLQFAVIFVNVTERKQSEEILHASQQKISDILGSIQDGFMQIDREWNFLYVNRWAADNLGWEPQALLGKNIWEIFPALHGTVQESNYRQVMDEGRPVHFEAAGVLTERCYDIRVYPAQEGISIIWVDVTERKRAEEEVRSSTIQIELQRRLLEQREQERQQIARDLHDGPVQELTGAHFALEELLKKNRDETMTQELQAIRQAIKDQVAELRSFAGELRPPALSKFGLEKAIRSHAEPFQEKHPGFRVSIDASEQGGLLPEDVRLALYRIYQEAMTNVAKHCQPAEVTIRLRKIEGEVRLEIVDHGPGFDLPGDWLALARGGHLGLVGMRERAEAIGGRLEIDSQIGQGTRIQVTVPLHTTV